MVGPPFITMNECDLGPPILMVHITGWAHLTLEHTNTLGPFIDMVDHFHLGSPVKVAY